MTPEELKDALEIAATEMQKAAGNMQIAHDLIVWQKRRIDLLQKTAVELAGRIDKLATQQKMDRSTIEQLLHQLDMTAERLSPRPTEPEA